MSTTASLRSVIDAPRRLDELSTARVIEQAAEAIHKAQKGGQPLGTVCPEAIQLGTQGVELVPPAAPPGGYTAPEVLEGKPADRRSDVFSLGVVLWEALTHTRLFPATSEGERRAEILTHEFNPPSWNNANIPAELDTIAKKALSKDPADRYPSAKVMAAEISTVLEDAGYPDDLEMITAYLREAFPPLSPGASLAAKLATAPSAPRVPLNQTMLGMAPLKEPAPPEVAPEAPVIELTQEKVVELTEPKLPAAPPQAPVIPEPPLERAKTPSAAPRAKSISTVPPILVPEIRPRTPSSAPLSPTAFAAKPETVPPPVNPLVTLPFGSMAVSQADIAKAAQELADKAPPATSGDSAPPITTTETAAPPITSGDKAPPTIASAETVATPALVPSDASATNKLAAQVIVEHPTTRLAAEQIVDASATNKLEVARITDVVAPPSSVAGLPASPPGAVDGPPLMPEPATLKTPASVDPAAAVSLPRARRESQGDGMLERWASTSDSHAALDDGYETEIEEAQRKQKKRLLVAIGGAFAAILVVIVVALAVGGSEKKPKPVEPPQVGAASRTAAEPATEPVAKATDSVAPAPSAGIDPGAGSAAPVDEAAAKIAADEAAAKVAADEVAAKVAADEAAVKAAADAEAAKVETARVAKDADDKRLAAIEAAKSDQQKAEDARLAKLAQDKADKAARLDAETAKAAQAKLEREAKATQAKQEREAKAAAAKDARAVAARQAEEARVARAEAQRAKLAAAPPKEPVVAKKAPVVAKEPIKKEPKRVAVAEPVDPYAEPKKSAGDPASAYKLGFQQYVRGDTDGALTTFRDSLSANPGYPPTYRGLGLVYEKMGQKNQARRAFSRYLQLSPSATDADQIRDRMERL